MNNYSQLLSYLPELLAEKLNMFPAEIWNEAEEIRLRIGQPVIIRCGIRERQADLIMDFKMLQDTLHHLIQYSYYAYEEDLAKGFITIEGGHRIGICGRMVIKHGQPAVLREISSMNIRFAKGIRGCGRRILPEIMEDGKPVNTLIISPPGCGKTTLLRDLARELSENRFHVAVCDERSEIGGMYQGKPSFDLGPRCDILDGCDKTWGIPMLIRSMGPQIIITDEIGKPEDIPAVMQCLVSGVTLLTSIHGTCLEDVLRSPAGELIKKGVFRRLVYLSAEKGAGTVREVAAYV